MDDWFAKRIDINRKVRMILVRHRVNLGRLRVMVTQNRVSLRGHLTTVKGDGDTLSDDIINRIFRDIEKIDGAGPVFAELENWSRDKGDDEEWVGDLCDHMPGEHTFSNIDMNQLKARMEASVEARDPSRLAEACEKPDPTIHPQE